RLRVSSGVLSKSQMKTVYHLAYKNKINSIHFTTRQAIQLHGLSIDDVCNIMEEGIVKDIFTRGSGGNYPRNVGLSPLSGVDSDEAFDVTPYAIATDKYFMSKITSYKLPRKLKVSFSSSYTDEAHSTVQDLGFIATKKNEEKYFRVFVGGGLGKNPKLALELSELIKPNDILYLVEGLTKLFIDEGDFKNKNKARVRYLVDKLGEHLFLQKFKEYSIREKEKGGLDYIPQPVDYSKIGFNINLKHPRLLSQKQEGLYSVYIHPIGGQLNTKDLNNLLHELDKVKKPMIRLSMTKGFYIINLDGNEAKRILEITTNISADSPLEHSVSCIGVPICQMGIQNSQKMLTDIINYFKANGNDDLLYKLPKIYISGCLNSCGVHQIGGIGLCGKIKNIDGKATDVFELFINGNFELNKARLGSSLGDFKACDLPIMLYELALLLDKDFYTSITKNQDKLLEL
ncbi:MAG: nitrite/sulfite reductase, partial [Peptostreptococcaceae bacterium]